MRRWRGCVAEDDVDNGLSGGMFTDEESREERRVRAHNGDGNLEKKEERLRRRRGRSSSWSGLAAAVPATVSRQRYVNYRGWTGENTSTIDAGQFDKRRASSAVQPVMSRGSNCLAL